MTVFIVGASAAGLYTALFLKKAHPEYEVVVFDRTDKIGKKIFATGNGHCNLFNQRFSGAFFNHPAFVEALLERHSAADCLASLSGLGIATLVKDDLVYPLSYSAATFVKLLGQVASKLGIVFHLGERVLDYQTGKRIKLMTDQGQYEGDQLIFASGGKSQESLGSDGSLFPVFAKHGYQIVPLTPSLCPLKTKEKTKAISGVRHGAKVTLQRNGTLLYEEVGEVLWKDDGLSGIAVFNASAFLARSKQNEATVTLDLFPESSESELEKVYQSAKSQGFDPLESLLETKLANYVKNYAKTEETKQICRILKAFPFHVTGLYPFASSQVTSGGIALSQIAQNCFSKIEKNVAFVGEVLDIDGLCGGFNLGFALLSSLQVVERL